MIIDYDKNQLAYALANALKERDEAKDDLEFRRELYRVQENYLELARRERDEARNRLADALQEVDCRTLDYERIKEQNAKLSDIADGCLIALERATKYLPEYSRINYEDALWRLRKKLEEEAK